LHLPPPGAPLYFSFCSSTTMTSTGAFPTHRHDYCRASAYQGSVGLGVAPRTLYDVWEIQP
jgi:hypothetical protein